MLKLCMLKLAQIALGDLKKPHISIKISNIGLFFTFISISTSRVTQFGR